MNRKITLYTRTTYDSAMSENSDVEKISDEMFLHQDSFFWFLE